MAATLMKENQNSVSAKKRTESAFEVKITTMNRALQIHTGVPGNICADKSGSGEFGPQCDRPGQPIQDRDGEACSRTDEFGRIHME